MKKPRIAIPVPTATDIAYNQRSWPSYAEAVERSGGESVRVELGLSHEELASVAETCDGICLPGSPADVKPSLYGAELDPATSPSDQLREICDFFLLEHAEKHGKPVLAICYGMQSLNVWRGGSLVQDLNPLPVNHGAGGKVAVAHTITVPTHCLLGSLLANSGELQAEASATGDYAKLPVNSSHHQAVASPGDGLRIVARCQEDGVIEAIESSAEAKPHTSEAATRAQFLLGVQWHPERSFEISTASRALFARLIVEAGEQAG